MFERITLGILAVLLIAPAAAASQDWREMTAYRQLSGAEPLDVHVRYGAGELRIEPASPGELYRVDLRYDADVFDPVASFRNGVLEVGVDGQGRGINIKSGEGGELRLGLSNEVPLQLDLDFGAVEADLELGGLRVVEMDVETGASDTELRFSEPNAAACERLEITMGAAAFTARGLANANCRVVRSEGGVGDLTLDFTGEWRQDIHADLTMALGSVKLIVPENVGVRIDKSTFLTDLDAPGFYKRSGTHYSDNWDRAERRLTVELEGAFGSMEIRRAAPSVLAP